MSEYMYTVGGKTNLRRKLDHTSITKMIIVADQVKLVERRNNL